MTSLKEEDVYDKPLPPLPTRAAPSAPPTSLPSISSTQTLARAATSGGDEAATPGYCKHILVRETWGKRWES
jgi:hypothetical protein